MLIGLAALAAALSPETFAAQLLAADSATAVLQTRCPVAVVRAVRIKRADVRVPDYAREALQPGAADAVQVRRVKLKCGSRTFSIADNWYVPQRLTPAMNRALEQTDTPYGRVIAPLKARRITLGADRSERGNPFLTVRAVLMSETGARLAVVEERYQRRLLKPRFTRPPESGPPAASPSAQSRSSRRDPS